MITDNIYFSRSNKEADVEGMVLSDLLAWVAGSSVLRGCYVVAVQEPEVYKYTVESLVLCKEKYLSQFVVPLRMCQSRN